MELQQEKTSAAPDKQHRYLNQQVQQLNEALSKLAIEKRNLHTVEQKLTEKLHSCIELIAGRHTGDRKSTESEKQKEKKLSCGRKEKETREIFGTSSINKHSPTVDFSPESATVNNTDDLPLDSLDSTVCLDFNVKSSEEELVCAEVIYCQTTTTRGTYQPNESLDFNVHCTPKQPRPLPITKAPQTCPSKVIQQQKLKFPEPELEDGRSIRKSLSRLLFRRNEPKRTAIDQTVDPNHPNNSERKPSSSSSSSNSSNISNSSSFCSKQASTAAPISRSAIAWQLLERINSQEKADRGHQPDFEDFEESLENEEVDEDESEDVCSNSSSLDCCTSSSPPPAFCTPLLPTAYRSNFILRENSDIYTTATSGAHLYSRQ